MVSRFIRRLTASLAVAAAFCLAPGMARADVQILVEEYAPGANIGVDSPLASQYTNYTTSQVLASGGLLSYNFTNGVQFGVTGSLTTNSFTSSTSSSLTPSFSGLFKAGFDPNDSSVTSFNTLRITVTDDHFTGGDPANVLTNRAGTSNGFANNAGTLNVNTQSVLLNNPLTTPTSSTTNVAAGTQIGPATLVANASLPPNLGNNPETSVAVSSLPASYAIQQTITVEITRTGTFSPGATFGGSGGASIDPQMVPAPGGLVLAMIALPLLGLRRTLRKRTEAAA